MNIVLRVILIVIMILYLAFITRAVKRKNMRISYLVFWIIIGIFLIIALLFPNLIFAISELIGFEVPLNMIFSIAIFIVLYFIHDLMTIVSKEEKKNTLLIQEISILKKRVEKLEQEINKNEKKKKE